MPAMVDPRRLRRLNERQEGAGPVLYWMHREHRGRDNWGLAYARMRAVEMGRPLAVVYCLSPGFLGACLRQYGFLTKSLKETLRHLESLGIPFLLLQGDPVREVPGLARQLDAALVTTDFDSLRPKRRWLDATAQALASPLIEVDSRNVVPCLAASDKREYAARTIRPKIHRLLPEFLHEIPQPASHPVPWKHSLNGSSIADLDKALARLAPDPDVLEVDWIAPGEQAALARLEDFLANRLPAYQADRNDPAKDGQSGLSTYLHFGMLSGQRVALETLKQPAGESRDAFIEELVVRRELADNFCFHAQDYDQVSCFPDWALKTLDKHRGDRRPALYEQDALENARTHDPLWNAAQTEMQRSGRMHGYLRMYWAKKIFEWSPGPEEAMARAVYLNDRYFLDGREANGYAGITWSMGGVHDRPWQERAVFGTVRYMNMAGARRKFDVDAYIARVAAMDRG